MPTVNKIARHNKLNTNFTNAFQFSSNSDFLESFKFKLCNLHKTYKLTFFKANWAPYN